MSQVALDSFEIIAGAQGCHCIGMMEMLMVRGVAAYLKTTRQQVRKMVQNGELAALKVGREYRVTLVALAELSILQQIPTFPMCTIKVRQEDVCESAYIERDTLEYWAFQCSAKRSNCFTHRVHRLNPALATTKKPETVRFQAFCFFVRSTGVLSLQSGTIDQGCSGHMAIPRVTS